MGGNMLSMRQYNGHKLLLIVLTAVLLVSCSEKREPVEVAKAGKALGRVIVIGFDGLDPGMVRKWVAQGRLPTFARLIRQGAFGDLWSVLPPSSASAWTSAMTGVNPGKHGIYGFLKPTSDPNAPPVFNTSLDRGFAAVWDVLGSYGRKACVINIPLTSPADSLNGIMIAGFPHASDDKRSYYWPDSIESQLGDYSFDAFRVTCAKNREDRFLQKMQGISSNRLTLGLRFFDEMDWDLFWLVFTFTDRYQHYLWKYMDENHPMYDPVIGATYKHAIEDAYVRADNYLARFMDRMDANDLLIVMSDHGFGHLYYTINSNNFLQRTLGTVEVSNAYIHPTDFFGAKFKIDVSGPGAEERYMSLRKRLIEGLRSVTDPLHNVPIIDSIYVKEQIYKGPYLSNAPDILCLEKPGYLFFSLPKTPDLRLLDRGPSPDKAFSGFHRRRGTIGVFGKYVIPGKELEAKIVDIAAIIYAYLGVPAPSEIDGRIPQRLFVDTVPQPVQLVKSDEPGYRRPVKLARQDSKKIEKQLRAVGYIQ